MPKKTKKVPAQPTTTGSTRRRTMGHDSAPGGTRVPRKKLGGRNPNARAYVKRTKRS